eukprot:CAMPEP_0183805620 /NCGR_PEP_ID=MMETSP0803_2-20130417/37648_1 /TAXON_ID=195967 /ORGANISM="Crustomastix stigmata, Strain CCMP3273" /LENGTH=88 /DNA_ID=CAMNT_0026050375 /DNA_START=26 /DNA_END=288 /DNA_ORIENTATION=-
MKPSCEPVASIWPSGENAAHSGCPSLPIFSRLASLVGACSSSARSAGAAPAKRSNLRPAGRAPTCCCHFSAWPSSVTSRLAGTALTSR